MENKVTLYYNKIFKNNYNDLIRRAVELWKIGKIDLINMEEKFKETKNCWKLIHDMNDLEDMIQRLKWRNIENLPMSVLVYLMGREPSEWLKSGIATWKYHNRNYSSNSGKEIKMIIDKIERGEW